MAPRAMASCSDVTATFTNTVEVGSATSDPDPSDNVDDADTTILGLADLGVAVEYVGAQISNLIKDGYVPLVW